MVTMTVKTALMRKTVYAFQVSLLVPRANAFQWTTFVTPERAARTERTRPDVVSKTIIRTTWSLFLFEMLLNVYPLTAGRSCSNDQFSCTGGECLPWSLTCDGEKDCEDGSDEPSICGMQ